MPTRPNDRPKGRTTRTDGVRLQKVMASAGLGSRRACESMIADGRVRVNGRAVRELPVLVRPGLDEVEVDGELIGVSPGPRARPVYVMLYKPRQTVTTLDDPAGRRTVADLVQHPSGERLYPVGRLDFDTMGLLLLTNDGEMANRLTHPRYGIHKTYRAIVKGSMTPEDVARIERGIYLAERKDGATIGVSRTIGAKLSIIKTEPSRTILDITLAEGRNRQVRRMLAKVERPVRKLVRISMGPLRLKALALGAWRDLTQAEVKSLRQATGLMPGTPKKERRGRPEPMGRALRAARLGPSRKASEGGSGPDTAQGSVSRAGARGASSAMRPEARSRRTGSNPGTAPRPASRTESPKKVEPVSRKPKASLPETAPRRLISRDGVVRRRGSSGKDA